MNIRHFHDLLSRSVHHSNMFGVIFSVVLSSGPCLLHEIPFNLRM